MAGHIEMINSDSYKIQHGTKFEDRKALGRAIAELYIASQNVSMDASDAACEMIQRFDHDFFVMYGFNTRMESTQFDVRVEPGKS